MSVKKTFALRGMFLRSILGTPSPHSAFPFFSFLCSWSLEETCMKRSHHWTPRYTEHSSYLRLKRSCQNVKTKKILMLWRWPFQTLFLGQNCTKFILNDLDEAPERSVAVLPNPLQISQTRLLSVSNSNLSCVLRLFCHTRHQPFYWAIIDFICGRVQDRNDLDERDESQQLSPQ
jgi:hypothetical protein